MKSSSDNNSSPSHENSINLNLLPNAPQTNSVSMEKNIKKKSSPEKFEKFYNDGKQSFADNNFKAAVDNFSRAIEYAPNSVNAWVQRGLALKTLFDYQAALLSFGGAFKIDKKLFDQQILELPEEIRNDLNLQGLIYCGQGRYADAIRLFEQAKTTNNHQTTIEAWHNHAKTLQIMGQWRKAQQCFDEGLRLFPNNDHLMVSKAYLLFTINKYSDAQQCFESVIQDKQKSNSYDGSCFTAYYGLGKLHVSQCQYDQAITCFNHILVTSNDNHKIWRKREAALNNKMKYEEKNHSIKNKFKLTAPSFAYMINKSMEKKLAELKKSRQIINKQKNDLLTDKNYKTAVLQVKSQINEPKKVALNSMVQRLKALKMDLEAQQKQQPLDLVIKERYITQRGFNVAEKYREEAVKIIQATQENFYKALEVCKQELCAGERYKAKEKGIRDEQMLQQVENEILSISTPILTAHAQYKIPVFCLPEEIGNYEIEIKRIDQEIENDSLKTLEILNQFNEKYLKLRHELEEIERQHDNLLYGFNITLKDLRGDTPLHKAARLGYVNCVKLLLSHGASPHDQYDFEGHSPLGTAILHKQETVVSELLKHTKLSSAELKRIICEYQTSKKPDPEIINLLQQAYRQELLTQSKMIDEILSQSKNVTMFAESKNAENAEKVKNDLPNKVQNKI